MEIVSAAFVTHRHSDTMNERVYRPFFTIKSNRLREEKTIQHRLFSAFTNVGHASDRIVSGLV